MIVPGSPLLGANHAFSWYAKVVAPDGHEWTYWFNGPQSTREQVAKYIAGKFGNVKVLTIDRCTTMPIGVLRPVPPEHYLFDAVTKEIEAFYGGNKPEKIIVPFSKPVRNVQFRKSPRALAR